MQNMKVKQSVEYNGKRYTLPFLVAKESLSTEQDTVKKDLVVSHVHCQHLLLLCMM